MTHLKYIVLFIAIFILFIFINENSFGKDEFKGHIRIDIQLHGTPINIVPTTITCVVKNPKLMEKIYYNSDYYKNNIKYSNWRYACHFWPVYIFIEPNKISGDELGDIIYDYTFESKYMANEFIEFYKLSKGKKYEIKNQPYYDQKFYTKYYCSPGYFICITYMQEGYSCPMHPEVQKFDTGTCQICGMKLIMRKIFVFM